MTEKRRISIFLTKDRVPERDGLRGGEAKLQYTFWCPTNGFLHFSTLPSAMNEAHCCLDEADCDESSGGPYP